MKRASDEQSSLPCVVSLLEEQAVIWRAEKMNCREHQMRYPQGCNVENSCKKGLLREKDVAVNKIKLES
ncbi:hypothetical protein HPP92_028764 [Vanilla planifolia]|uniref:Uncharacterized protein n=1 Tax=Vanilla planifolia TaxID=51239 RepID=A0A835P6J4_VANPL|nr:hypothetical protein HPP92_028764 [Vanilla planifolia]KAG0446609.1 hypothetical protein HPP92_028750 [Vanilla planifolia]